MDREEMSFDFNVEDVGAFRITAERVGGMISVQPNPGVSDETLNYWLLRYMIPFYLARDCSAVLFHGSSVKMGNGAVAFLAKSMGGKSTLANYLQHEGHPLIADDDLRVDGEQPLMAHPSIPFVRAYRRQEDLGKRVERFIRKPEPLRRVYILELSDSPTRIVPLPRIEAVAALLQQCRFRLIERAVERFRFCSRMAASCPVARLIVPQDISRLPEVHRALLRDGEECP